MKNLSRISAAALVAIFTATGLNAHPGPGGHSHIMSSPIAGRYNNLWYDYRTDVLEAEHEWRKDLRRAKTADDRREAEEEYVREVADAKKDYTKEMAERDYRRGYVIMGSR